MRKSCQVLLNLKKIFPKYGGPVTLSCQEDNNLENVTWEATAKDFEVLKNY